LETNKRLFSYGSVPFEAECPQHRLSEPKKPHKPNERCCSGARKMKPSKSGSRAVKPSAPPGKPPCHTGLPRSSRG
jgi:hypothetical protein